MFHSCWKPFIIFRKASKMHFPSGWEYYTELHDEVILLQLFKEGKSSEVQRTESCSSKYKLCNMDFFDDTESVWNDYAKPVNHWNDSIKVKPPWCVHHHYSVKQLHPRPC